MGIPGSHQRVDLPATGDVSTEERPAALIGKSVLAMRAKFTVDRKWQAQEAHAVPVGADGKRVRERDVRAVMRERAP